MVNDTEICGPDSLCVPGQPAGVSQSALASQWKYKQHWKSLWQYDPATNQWRWERRAGRGVFQGVIANGLCHWLVVRCEEDPGAGTVHVIRLLGRAMARPRVPVSVQAGVSRPWY